LIVSIPLAIATKTTCHYRFISMAVIVAPAGNRLPEASQAIDLDVLTGLPEQKDRFLQLVAEERHPEQEVGWCVPNSVIRTSF
jgi:hypothetical protein